MTDYKYLIDVTDICLEAMPSGTIVVFANETGRDAITDLIPDFPFHWIAYSGWKTTAINPANVSSIEPKNMIGLCIALLKADCRIVVKEGPNHKELETEEDIQKLRKH